jgi:hypothetical protein
MSDKNYPPFRNSLEFVPAGFPQYVKSAKPGPFVFNNNWYFKSASGDIYLSNGNKFQGDFENLEVIPVIATWIEKPAEDDLTILVSKEKDRLDVIMKVIESTSGTGRVLEENREHMQSEFEKNGL